MCERELAVSVSAHPLTIIMYLLFYLLYDNGACYNRVLALKLDV
jgi:hypothetical protein